MNRKFDLKFLFAILQSILALSALALAVLLNFNVLNIQSSLNIADQALIFYNAILTIFGVTFLLGGLFLIYEWWEA